MTALLKKLGIVAAATTAAILAVSPLAFAGDDNGDDDNGHKKHDKDHSKIEDSQICSADQAYGGLLNVLNIANGNVLSCDNVNVQVAVIGDNSVDQ